MGTDHINSALTLSMTVHIMSIIFADFLSDFQAIFALITIFKNVHRPHQQYPNTINNSLDHVYSLFSDFTAIFILITIFGKVHRPSKKYPNIVTNTHDQHHPFFSDSITGPCQDTPNHHHLVFLNCLVIHFFLIFWLQCVSYHIWKCAQTM